MSNETQPQHDSPRILVADDTPELREILTLRVQSLGNQVFSASNGREALDLLAVQPIDLVLLDIMMPEMNGYQVLETMKANAELRHIPVIVISAVSELDSVVRCIQLGAEDYLPKPFNSILLRARLEASLERKRLRDQEQALLEVVDAERMRAEKLLLNILPEPIGERLKAGEKIIADDYQNVSVMFADLVGFTSLAAQSTPQEMVSNLNEIFSFFDEIADRYGIEKIKTIGDGVMLVTGAPLPRGDHAMAAANAALALRAGIQSCRWNGQQPLDLRIGIHSGPVIAGVIGAKKFSYDLWGDTVNVAHRLQTTCEPGKIQVSNITQQLLQGSFTFTERGSVAIKGWGEMPTYYLEAPL